MPCHQAMEPAGGEDSRPGSSNAAAATTASVHAILERMLGKSIAVYQVPPTLSLSACKRLL